MSKRMGTLLGFLVFATAVSAAHLIEEGRGASDLPLLFADKQRPLDHALCIASLAEHRSARYNALSHKDRQHPLPEHDVQVRFIGAVELVPRDKLTRVADRLMRWFPSKMGKETIVSSAGALARLDQSNG